MAKAAGAVQLGVPGPNAATDSNGVARWRCAYSTADDAAVRDGKALPLYSNWTVPRPVNVTARSAVHASVMRRRWPLVRTCIAADGFLELFDATSA